jgi:ADP-ribosylglycohydrolase
MADAVPTETYLRKELRALHEEGLDTSEPARRLDAVAGATPEKAAAERGELCALLADIPRRPDFDYVEPSDLAEIHATRPEKSPQVPTRPAAGVLDDRTLGAWLGRSAGCLVGKLCEGWSRARIERALRALDAWPLSDYWPRAEQLPEGLEPWSPEAQWDPDRTHYPDPDSPQLRGNISRMLRDDDMDYPILGLHVLEAHGAGFTTMDVARAWLGMLPYDCVYTAERVAYRNLVNELEPPETASFRNPYREWIGAQIRADIWAWAAPARPELAAEFAWRDAALSHTKNGIYGEMFFAALLSAAFAESDLHRLVEIGLSEIPSRCRLREAVLDTVGWCDSDPDWETTWDKINAKYGHYHGVHTINNAAIVLMGLLHGGGDYEKAITIAVMGGWDTDCNGATAGAVMGTILGARALPEKWIGPLNDRISSIVVGYTDCLISELAQRTRAVQDAAVGA